MKTVEEYSEQDLRYAKELRDECHREALAIIRKTRPDITEAVDSHPVEDYFQRTWEYPGRWYTVVAIPEGYRSREAFVDHLVRDTLSGAPAAHDTERNRFAPLPMSAVRRDDDPFYAVLAEYPDCVVDYCIVKATAPYAGYESHCRALQAAWQMIGNADWQGDPSRASGAPMPSDELFSSDDRTLNYRKAFLYPPHENGYTGKDFVRVNASLFPNGTDALEVYRWTTDWSDYFDEGHEWWGTLCLTVYDQTLGRFAVITASATD